MESRAMILRLRESRFAQKEILHYFTASDERIAEIVRLSTTSDIYPVQEHSSWVLIHVTQHNSKKLEKYQEKIIDYFLDLSSKSLEDSKNQTLLRNLCKVLTELPLIAYRDGEFLDQLIAHLKNPENKVALQVYSLTKITAFVKKYPELKPEIAELIDMKIANGLQSSMRQVVRNFEKIK